MKHLPIIPLLFLSFTICAQRSLTIEEASGMNPKLIPASLSQLQWRPGTNNYLYVAGGALVQGTPGKQGRDTLVRLADLNTLLKYNRFDTLKRFPSVTFITEDAFRYIDGNNLFLVDIMKNSVEKINSWDEKAVNLDFDETGRAAAYTLENNLYLALEGKQVTVTREENKGIVYGSERVHRNEWGISKGTFWSPDGKKIAFYRMDESMVSEYPLVDASARIATVNPTRYPMAGMASHRVSLGIYHPASGKTLYLEPDSLRISDPSMRFEYLTNITWSPDGKHIYVAALNRDQNHMQLNQYDAASGRYIRTLFEEKDTAYVEPLQGPKFFGDDPDRFIWESRRDGFNHLYLYESSGKMVKQITGGPWEVTGFTGADPQGDMAWFLGNTGNPLERHIYSVDIRKGAVKQLSSAPGTHSARVSDDGRYILDTYSSVTVPRQTDLLDANGTRIETLLAAGDPLKEIRLGETSFVTLMASDGTELFARLIKPTGFDPGKKYPVIIYVYGGPHSQLVTNTWLGGGGLFLNYLADRGYVVFTLDNRGTAGRGRGFEQAIFRNLGTVEVDDQMTGVRYLKGLSFVDTTRLGLNGWSYGGFMTISMMLKNPGVFKAAVCGGPVIDWKYYEVMYGERYMDTPESNPEGYRRACLTNYVQNLTGKLLIIHDDQDGTVVPQNSVVFLKKCVDEGKQVDFFLYPGHEHNVRGKDRVHLNAKMAGYLEENL